MVERKEENASPKRARRRMRETSRPAIKADAPTGTAISFSDAGENAYADAIDEGHRIDPRAQKIFVAAVVLVVLYFVGVIIPKNIFNEALHTGGSNAGYTLSWFVGDLQYNVNRLIGALMGNDDPTNPISDSLVRYVMVALTGAGLGVCGAVYQGSFRNALVSPSTLGVMSGASLGIIVYVVFFVADDGSNVAWLAGGSSSTDPLSYLWSMYGLSVLSFIGCMLVVGIVLLTMRLAGKGTTSPFLMIITGQVIGSIAGALSNTVRYYYLSENAYGVKAQLLTELQISSFYRDYSLIDIVAVGVPLVVTFAVVMRLRRRMTLLSFTEEEARTMGVDSRRMQVAIVGLCTLLTAIIISFVGSIGFVGFIVPHLARRLVGPNFSYLLPATAVLGAVFVLGAYVLLLTTFGSSYETMLGMYISIAGAVVFLATALRGKGGARGAFN